MDHISGTPREQITLLPEAIDDYGGDDNPVRFVDAFADSLDMQSLGFRHAVVNETGRPAYDPKDLHCPQGHTMQFYSRSSKEGRNIRIYRTNSCSTCPVRTHCTTSPRGRYINRWEHEAVLVA